MLQAALTLLNAPCIDEVSSVARILIQSLSTIPNYIIGLSVNTYNFLNGGKF